LFLLSSGGFLTSVWIAAHWPAIAAAAHHAEQTRAVADPTGFQFFSAADAADVEAIAGQIVPSGATPGARDTHAVYFIDRGLATFFRPGLKNFARDSQSFKRNFLPRSRQLRPSPGPRRMNRSHISKPSSARRFLTAFEH
jgi:hypothetical protein